MNHQEYEMSFLLIESHKQQNGLKDKYPTGPFCALEKAILILVRSLDCYWNRFVHSLYLLQTKLADLGIVIVNNEVFYVGHEEPGDV